MAVRSGWWLRVHDIITCDTVMMTLCCKLINNATGQPHRHENRLVNNMILLKLYTVTTYERTIFRLLTFIQQSETVHFCLESHRKCFGNELKEIQRSGKWPRPAVCSWAILVAQNCICTYINTHYRANYFTHNNALVRCFTTLIQRSSFTLVWHS